MTKWEYLWRDTYYRETERTEDYITRLRYGHFWKPDLENEVWFPDQDAIDAIGAKGWELVTITTASVTLITAISPQGNDGYTSFPTHRLFFKRPLSA